MANQLHTLYRKSWKMTFSPAFRETHDLSTDWDILGSWDGLPITEKAAREWVTDYYGLDIFPAGDVLLSHITEELQP